MNKDTDGGLQPGRDPDDIDAAQSALNRMREAAASRGEIRRKAPPRPGTTPQKTGRSTGSTRGFGQFHCHRPGPDGSRQGRWADSLRSAAGALPWPSAR